MASRAIRLCFALLWLVWAGIIVPGHTRGAITMPGSDAAKPISGAGCCSPSSSHNGEPGNSSEPTSGDRARCAVCYLAAVQAPPPPVVAAPLPVGLLERLAIASPVVVDCQSIRPCIHERAPPRPN